MHHRFDFLLFVKFVAAGRGSSCCMHIELSDDNSRRVRTW